MGKLETMIKSEIERLSTKEIRRFSVPLKRDIRSLKMMVSQLHKAVLPLERFTARKQNELARQPVKLDALPEEVKKSRFSPRLVKTLRKKLGLSQRKLGILMGVSLGAVQMWEAGKFAPKREKKAAFVALRKLGRTEVKKLLARKTSGNGKG